MPKINHGFTLIEVLISFILLSFILFEFDGMQIAAMKKTAANYYFRIASGEVDSMYERLSVIRNASGLSDQISRWQKQIKTELPNANGKVWGHFPHYGISLSWGNISACTKTKIGFAGCLLQEFQLPV